MQLFDPPNNNFFLQCLSYELLGRFHILVGEVKARMRFQLFCEVRSLRPWCNCSAFLFLLAFFCVCHFCAPPPSHDIGAVTIMVEDDVVQRPIFSMVASSQVSSCCQSFLRPFRCEQFASSTLYSVYPVPFPLLPCHTSISTDT